jgi:CHAT domain-containing protein
MATAELKLNLLDDARTHLETAITFRDEARSKIASLELGATSFAGSPFLYPTYADVLLHQHALHKELHLDELAFETVEQARSRALIASLSDTIARVQDHVDPQLRERERHLLEEMNATALQLQLTQNPKSAEALTVKSQQLAGELSSLHGEIRRSSPSFASLIEPSPLRIQEIRDTILDPNTTLIEYSLSDVASYVFVVSKDKLRAVPLAPRTDIDAASQRVIRALTDKKRADADFAAASAGLSRLILAPVGHLRPEQRLLIVTDGALGLVPFAALPEPGGKAGTYMIFNHEIVHLPSASALATMRQLVAMRSPQPRKEIAILADPQFDKSDVRTPAPAIPEELQRTLNAMGINLPRLTFSAQEGESIRKLAPSGSRLLTGPAANRAMVMGGGLSNYRMIHFATHGLVNTDQPSLSGIVLSLVDEKGKSQDGFLRLHDIYNLRLNADLVVLSACQTAVGPNVNGEGVMSLSRGFFYAGASRVMASLWKVDDRATAELMRVFYQNLFAKKVSPAAALRAAQREMQSRLQFASPYYWAAFELQGEWK